MKKSTYFSLDRNILEWRWFKDKNTLQVFIFLLASANIQKHGFGKTDILRGELATSYGSIALATGLTVNEVRTAISHLKSTGTITAKKYPKYQVISMVNYDYYQTTSQAKSQANHSQATVKSQASHNNQISKEVNKLIKDMPAAKNDWRNQ